MNFPKSARREASQYVQQKQQQAAQQPAAVTESDQAGPTGLRGRGGFAARQR